ncbi:hypothetical protein F5877DRAFT_84593 [Lentinula edodes]|nr:hypothetical protein F5877DRAFT_84593 [Lentinula edodes]
MVMLARNMETEPLKLHLLTHAAICRSENKYASNNSQSSSVKEVVDVAMNQLSKHVEIPADTKNVLRMIARDECANPTRSSYGDVGIAVWARCKAEANMHDLTEMLSKTKSETALKKAAKAAGNKILQQFRDDIMTTIVVDESGKITRCSLLSLLQPIVTEQQLDVPLWQRFLITPTVFLEFRG